MSRHTLLSFQSSTKMREALTNNFGQAITFNACSGQTIINNNRSIGNLLALSDKSISIEICPNKSLDPELLSQLNLNFCSVTWHNPLAADLKRVNQIPAILLTEKLCLQGYNVLLHLAGRNLKKQQLLEILYVIKNVGVKNIFALQGDPSQIVENDDRSDFPYAIDLVRFIRSNFGNHFCVGVAGYPEKHPKSKNVEDDIKYLKEKVSAGADFIITQASYDYEAFKNFSKLCKTSNVNVPIIPGIFIIPSYKSFIAMSKFCDVPLSPSVLTILTKIKNNDIAVKEFGIHHATMLTKNILSDNENLFRGFHIFSLNDLQLVKEVLRRLELFKPRLEYPLLTNYFVKETK